MCGDKRHSSCCTHTLSSNVRIKRSRPAPEILILHHVCDRWSRLITEYGELTPPSQPSPLSQMFWVAPLKPDAVYIAFERAVRRNTSVPRAELRYTPTTPLYKSVSFVVVLQRIFGLSEQSSPHVPPARRGICPGPKVNVASMGGVERQTFKTELHLMRESCGDGPAR